MSDFHELEVVGRGTCSTNNITLTNNSDFIFYSFNPFKPEFTIVIFIHYKPRIAVAILNL